MVSIEPDGPNAWEPQACWTFEHALLLLKQASQGHETTKCLDAFLDKNAEVITGGLPFQGQGDNCPDEFTLRGVSYKNELTAAQRTQTKDIAKILGLDLMETSRITTIAAKRIPSSSLHLTTSSEVSLEDSTDERSYFLSRVTREQRTVIRIALLLLKNNRVAASSHQSRKIAAQLARNGYKLIEVQLESIRTIYGLINGDDELIATEYCLTLVDLLNYLCYLILTSERGFTKPTVQEWFKLMQDTAYLSGTPEMSDSLEALCTTITLLFLDLDFNYGSPEESASFMNDPADLYAINALIQNSAPNPVIIYAWSIILHRRYVSLQLDDQNAQQFITKFGELDQIKRLYTGFAAQAANLDVTQALLKCYRRMSFDQVCSDILGSFVVAFVPYVKMTDTITAGIAEILSTASDSIVQRFFENPATEDMMSLARAKLPLSLQSFLALCSINANLASEELQNVSSYMALMPHEEFYYKYTIEDQNPDLVKLTQDVDVYPPFEASKEMSLHLKAGTQAQIFPSASKDTLVVAFLYQYSGWSLIGRILRNLSIHLDTSDDKVGLLIQIYKLLAKVFKDPELDTEHILHALDSFAGKNDVIDITFRILDQILILRHVPLLAAIVDFTTALAENGYTYRVWSYLYKSEMLGLKPSGGLAATILGTREMVSGSYEFTLSLLDLTSVLVQNCIRIDKVSRKLKAQVVDRFVEYLLQVFENFTNWKYLYEYQRLQIGTEIVNLFNLILESLYGVDGDSSPEDKVNGAFAPAAKRLTTILLVSGVDDARAMKSILSSFIHLASSFSDSISTDLVGFWNARWFQGATDFCCTLLKVRSVSQATPSTLESVIYSHVPQLVNIYLNNLDKRCAITNILTNLVSAKWNMEPPSLLTHLKQQHTEILLRCLSSDMSNRAETYKLKIHLCDFFSSVMEGNQEGLSIVFITGGDIKDSLKPQKRSGADLSLLSVLKRDISLLSYYPSNVALHLADAMALAFSSWTSAEQGDDSNFARQLVSKLEDWPEPVDEAHATDQTYIEFCYEIRLVSKVAEIISLYLFVSKNNDSKQMILKRLNEPSFIAKLNNKFRIIGYKESLQKQVKVDFHKFWPQFRIEQFVKSVGYRQHRFGVESIYSFTLMRMLLGNDDHWPVMKKEITDSSINVQYASAQISTAKAYGALITCICKVDPQRLSPSYLQLAADLLRDSDDERVPSQLFESIFRARIELAFFICMSFSLQNKFRPQDKVLFSVLEGASRLLDSEEIDLVHGLLSTNVTYYKPLLRILLICFELVPHDSTLLVEYSMPFCDVYSEVICRSSKLLFDSIRNQGLSAPSDDLTNSSAVAKPMDDLTLMFSMLQAFFRLNLEGSLKDSVATATINTGLLSSLSTVYNVSHLIKVNDEEVFADYSLMFLRTLAENKSVARKMVDNGLFSVLIESPISVRIQRGNIRPYAVSRSRLHHLWSDGLLPIVLTLVGFFGDSVLAETCLFATSFERQISSTIQAWYASDSAISTQFIEETSQIILLAKVLNTLDAYNYIRNCAGDETTPIKLVPGLDGEDDRKKLATAFNYLISHPKYLTLRIVPADAEEQRLLQSDNNVKFIESVLDKLKQLKESLE